METKIQTKNSPQDEYWNEDINENKLNIDDFELNYDIN